MSSGATGRALVTTRHGGPEVMCVEERPRPEPGPGEVRVRLQAAAFNRLDLWVRRGIPGVRYPLPLVPCADGAGVVETLGPGVRPCRDAPWLAEGAEVVLYPVASCGHCRCCRGGEPQHCRGFGMLGESEDGCAQDWLVIAASRLLPKPRRLSFAEVAAMPTTFLTAMHMLRARAKVRPGEVVLVHGAGSGVGVAGIQIARALGAEVIASVRRERDVGLATDLGAAHVIRNDDPDWPLAVRALCPEGVDVVFDHLGALTWNGSVRSLRKGGRLVFCGATVGHEATLELRRAFFFSLSLLGSTMGTQTEMIELLRLAELGRLRPVIGASFRLEEGAAALAALEERDRAGKIVLSLGDREPVGH